MTRTLAVVRREVRAAFDSKVAYVTIALFVLALDGLFFFVGYPIGPVPLPSLFEGRQATLFVLFSWLPLLLAVLVPALTMSRWADERRLGTEELLLTYPLRTVEVVVGKFLAAWALLALLLAAAVLPAAVAVDRVGALDWASAWVGLGGAWLLAGAYAALALFVSACTPEQLVAFLVGALVLCLLWLLRLLVGVLPAEHAVALEYACPSTHFLDSAARGVIDLRDLVYFGSFVALGLTLNVLAVERRRWR